MQMTTLVHIDCIIAIVVVVIVFFYTLQLVVHAVTCFATRNVVKRIQCLPEILL